jgi:magnesium chelatase subunit I
MNHPHPSAKTVGELKTTGYRQRRAAPQRHPQTQGRRGLFPGIVGYRDSVIPQIVNGILSKHDLLFLGLRGQAKTRILRMLPQLLDEWIPVLRRRGNQR